MSNVCKFYYLIDVIYEQYLKKDAYCSTNLLSISNADPNKRHIK